jgi:hypothetical protein
MLITGFGTVTVARYPDEDRGRVESDLTRRAFELAGADTST